MRNKLHLSQLVVSVKVSFWVTIWARRRSIINQAIDWSTKLSMWRTAVLSETMTLESWRRIVQLQANLPQPLSSNLSQTWWNCNIWRTQYKLAHYRHLHRETPCRTTRNSSRPLNHRASASPKSTQRSRGRWIAQLTSLGHPSKCRKAPSRSCKIINSRIRELPG